MKKLRKHSKGDADMISFVVGFGIMMLLIVLGSYFLVDEEVSTDVEAEIAAGGTEMQTIIAANTIYQSDQINLQSQMKEYYSSDASQDSIESSIETEVEELLEENFGNYRFSVEDTDISISEDAPPGLMTFYVSTPEGPKEVRLMTDAQKEEPYEPKVSVFG